MPVRDSTWRCCLAGRGVAHLRQGAALAVRARSPGTRNGAMPAPVIGPVIPRARHDPAAEWGGAGGKRWYSPALPRQRIAHENQSAPFMRWRPVALIATAGSSGTALRRRASSTVAPIVRSGREQNRWPTVAEGCGVARLRKASGGLPPVELAGRPPLPAFEVLRTSRSRCLRR